MPDNHSTRPVNEGRPAWYITPLFWVAIAVLSLIVAPNWDHLLAEPAQRHQRASGAAFSTATDASAGETSVPAASSVFTERSYPAPEHVQAF